MKIVNLHGYLSVVENKNYQALCELFPKEDIVAPKLLYFHNTPKELLEYLSNITDEEDVIYVGQSIGGWYADKLSRKFSRKCILTNPCYYPHELPLIIDSGISKDKLAQYRQLSEVYKNELAYTLCSDNDSVLPNNLKLCEMLSHKVIGVKGSHSTIEDIRSHLNELFYEFGTESR